VRALTSADEGAAGTRSSLAGAVRKLSPNIVPLLGNRTFVPWEQVMSGMPG
jgi:hypothetical protein